MIFAGAGPMAQVQKVRHDLEKYCGLDTEAMIEILDVLRGKGF